MIEHSESIVIIKRGKGMGKDSYGNRTNTDLRVTVQGVGVAWGSENSDEQRGVIASRSVTFYLPAGTTIDPNDRIEFVGVTWKPEGFSQAWSRPASFSFVQTGVVMNASREEQGVNNGS